MTRVGEIIQRRGNTKFTDTKPELAFKGFARKYNLNISKPKSIVVKDDDEVEWEFTPDFQYENMYIFIDGPHHWTAKFRSKDRWQRNLTHRKTGKWCVGIDSPLLLDEQFWPSVLSSLLANTQPVIQIFA